MGVVARTAHDHLQAGLGALAEGRWQSALAEFSTALAERETPEALEGLSWAAWWQDDADKVFAAREQAYRLYRERGDAAAAGQMAIWLAVDELDFRGAEAVASGWLRRAHRLLDELEPCPPHGWLAFNEGYFAHAIGDTTTARTNAVRAAELGRRFSVPDLEMLGLALEGAALVACAEVEQGMGCLDEATAIALAGDASIPISNAWTCCFLVSACMAVQDLERSVAWCDRIAEFADRYGSRYMLAFCRAEYGAVELRRGRWSDAEALLEAAVEDFSSSRPAWVSGPLVGLAELRRRQGRREDAVALLEQAGQSRGEQLCRARIALDSGEPSRAAGVVERVLRQTAVERRLDRVPMLELLVQARVALGDVDGARTALVELRAVCVAIGTPLLQASADLLDGMVRAAEGDHERARPFIEDAIDRFAECGAPYECATARVELATSLYALGRDEAAAHEVSLAVERLLELGAPSQVERARSLVGLDAAPPTLTPREREVLALVADGLTDRQVAARLVVSEHTVHRHVTNILRKLDQPSRTAAAAHAVRAGLLDTPA